MIAETRTFIAEVPPDLMARIDLRDEELRLAAFAYSATVVAGQRCDFRKNERTQHEDVQ